MSTTEPNKKSSRVPTIATGLGVALLAVLAFATTRPNTFRIERSIRIHSNPATLYPLISDFHNWAVWSPYEKLDPAMKRTYSGSASDKGAVYAWDGNSKSGAGRMEITGTEVPSKITIKLDFTRPFEGHNQTVFSLDRMGEETSVTWAMEGPASYMNKLVGLFVNMDKLVGKDFENGLKNMKETAERR
jgi:Polyketide cyclase / dehydrase and lipid transport